MVRVKVRIMVRIRVWVRAWIRVRVGVKFADCCIQTGSESDKMRISHVIKTDQWRAAPQIRPAPHFVVSPSSFFPYRYNSLGLENSRLTVGSYVWIERKRRCDMK